MKTRKHSKTSLYSTLRRIPTGVVLFIGICLGLLVAQVLFRSSSPPSTTWSGGRTKSFHSQYIQNARPPVSPPTLEQRRRVLDLLTTLTRHHTKDCTRFSQSIYISQAEDRYSPLIGHLPPKVRSASSWLNPWKAFNEADDFLYPAHTELAALGHKYFFAINLYNSFDVIPDLFATLFRVGSILGYHNIYVSIYENGSTDQTKALLRILDALTRSVGLRFSIRTSNRIRGAFNHRIEYLAEVRNAAMGPLQELRDANGEVFDSIVFINDILPCVDDLLELIWQSRRQNAGITCAADYIFHEEIGAPVFYDNWVARDINGTALENAPFEAVFHHQDSSERFQKHLPVQVQSCWNGIAVLDPAPFYQPPYIRFRMARLTENECSASECSLICNDYWNAGYGRILMVPRVKLAYDRRVFDIIHPQRRNLSAIRAYVRLGGLPDDPRSDPQDRSWYGPHDRLFLPEEYEEMDFKPGPEYVWCWGWDGAGDLDGPDVEPIWERMSSKFTDESSVRIKHDRGIKL